MLRNSLLALIVLLLCALVLAAQTRQLDEAGNQQPVVVNAGFEEGPIGERPANWTVHTGAGFQVSITDQGAFQGNRSARLESPAGQALGFANLYQRLDATPLRGQRIRLRAAIRAEVEGQRSQAQMWLRVDRMDETGARLMGAMDDMSDRPIKNDQWNNYEIVATVDEDAVNVTVGMLLSGSGRAWIDDVSVDIVGDEVTPTATSKPGQRMGTPIDLIKPGLFEVTTSVRLTPNVGLWGSLRGWFGESTADPPQTVLMPLPLAYRDQIPLSFHLEVRPPEAIRSAEVYQDHGENFVLKLPVADLEKWKQVDIGFKSVVLVSRSDFTEVPASAEVPPRWPEEAQPWLAATWCADAANERIQSLANTIRAETNDVREIIRLVERQAKEIFSSATGFGADLTAVEALDKQGSCTSCANLVAALLRACDVPARILAGYPSWTGPLQTHYIVEAYVPGYGWYPIESTRCESPWPNTHQVNVSIVPVEYEQPSKAGLRMGIAPGVPYLSLTETPGNTGSVITTGTVEGARNCDHQCQMIRELAGNAEEWQQVLSWARPRWQEWLNTNHELNADGQLQFGKKSAELSAKSLSELEIELQGEDP